MQLDRDIDIETTGKRHPFLAKYKIGHHPDGRIEAADILRSVVVGDSIWTVSDRAVGRTPAAAPDGVTLIRF